MWRTGFLIVVLCLQFSGAPAQDSTIVAAPATPPDALDQALAVAGLTRGDLGWEPRGWWERYPEDIPYKLRHCDDLCAEPMAIVPFLRVMGATVSQTLTPENVAKGRKDTGAGALYRAVHDLGVNKRYGATRSYSANLMAPRTPLPEALLEAWKSEGEPTRFVTFGQEAPYPRIHDDLEKACAGLPPDISGILGRLVLDLLEARRWAVIGLRNVPLEMRERVAARLDLGEKETDALTYEPAMDDMMSLWDESSLWYAGLKTVEALDVARLALADSAKAGSTSSKASSTSAESEGRAKPADLDHLHIDLATPVGRVIVDGTGAGRIDVEPGAFLVVDLGGDDHYTGHPAASSPELPLSATLDLGGDDVYECGDRALGAGVTGVAVLLDAEGDDMYKGNTLGQGGGHFGMGVLIDVAGDDRYEQHYSGQGAGFFGIGLLLDLAGKDAYTLWSDGQGFGGVGGVGVLADRTGDDTYLAVPDPAVTGRPSYHSEAKIAVSDAQGCGMGRRGDGADGHSWAGGLGALLDAEGNDTYTAGNWGQGCGYWFGTGLLWDGAGNDIYHANGWASASGAHFCIGALVDESGDDVHSVTQNWGPGFGHDFTASILYDGGGNDLYECGGGGIGNSINRSLVLCLDAAGDDRYVMKSPAMRPGLATYDPRFLNRSGPSVYWTESTSVGLFLDCGGSDTYTLTHDPKDAQANKVPRVGNNVVLTDDPGSDTVKAMNRGIFVDRPDGIIDLDRPLGGKRQ